ncbi:hypothetical protein PS914_06765 [Pseudomonas fluorescens]|nr:hypothetical protein PS914_06765 [Pseudomonas fluorescens]
MPSRNDHNDASVPPALSCKLNGYFNKNRSPARCCLTH